MKAAVLKRPGELVVEDIPVPSWERDEVLVRVRACGICGSDLRYFQGENPWALHTLGEERPNPPNIILGHEFAGEVAETKDETLRDLVGARVVVSPYKACGRCRFCRRGTYNLCTDTIHLGHGAGWGEREYYPGGMAELCPAWADKIFPLPDSVSYEDAALLDIVGIAIHGMNVAHLAPGADVAILGSGPLGLSMVQIARIWGAKAVFCTDLSPTNLQVAQATGADAAIDATSGDPFAEILAQTRGKGVDVILDTVGSTETLSGALHILAPSGTLVNMATHKQELRLSLNDLAAERALRSSSNYFFHEFQTALDLAAAGQLNLKPLITHRFPLTEAASAFDMLLNRKPHGAIKVVLEP